MWCHVIIIILFVLCIVAFCSGYAIAKTKYRRIKINSRIVDLLDRVLKVFNYDAVTGDPEAIVICAEIDSLKEILQKQINDEVGEFLD